LLSEKAWRYDGRAQLDEEVVTMESSLIEQITGKVAALPLAQQREALALIETLENRARASEPSATPRSHRLKGVTAGPGPKLTLETLWEARKEMWAEFEEDEP
jgi:hypothetical protein